MGEQLVVAVVEDEPDLRQLVVDVLQDEGFVVLSLADPRRALALPPSTRPAVFLLDLMLPGMTGIELAGALRDGPFAHIPRIAMSASGAMVTRARTSGLFDAVLQKPFDIDQLIAVVRGYNTQA